MSEKRTMRVRKAKGEYAFEIKNANRENVFSVYGYSRPDGSLYINGLWVTRKQAMRMRDAITEVLEFSK